MTWGERLFWLLWFLRLFKPEWILSFYVPALGPLRAVSTLLLYLLLLMTLPARDRRLSVDRGYLLVFLSILLSTLFAENTGRAMPVLRSVGDSLVFFALSGHYIRNERSLTRLFRIYLGAFVFYGLAGMANRGLVPFHVLLNNEDAFGPFMAMGVPLMYCAHQAGREGRRIFFVTTLLCVGGVIVSFARGAFLSLCVAVVYLWALQPRKVLAALKGLALGVLGLMLAGTWLRTSGYWREIATITGSVRSDSHQGEDRFLLANKALKIFTMHPVLGAGPMNFGHLFPKVLTQEDVERKGTFAEQLYGRVPHNIYAQVLAELGLVGTVAFAAMLAGFLEKNRAALRLAARNRTVRAAWRAAYARGVLGAMLVYLVNGLVYDILYYHWLQDLLIINSVLGRRGGRDDPDPPDPGTRAEAVG